MIASQMCMPSTVPTSVGQGSAGATKARPVQYERKVATRHRSASPDGTPSLYSAPHAVARGTVVLSRDQMARLAEELLQRPLARPGVRRRAPARARDQGRHRPQRADRALAAESAVAGRSQPAADQARGHPGQPDEPEPQGRPARGDAAPGAEATRKPRSNRAHRSDGGASGAPGRRTRPGAGPDPAAAVTRHDRGQARRRRRRPAAGGRRARRDPPASPAGW